MEAGVGTGAVREILVVVGVAVGGLLLAVVAAFAPWYNVSAGPGETEVVEMRAPAGRVVGDLATSPDAG
ncbi:MULTISPECIES: hypothetical protein [Polymorphospora]|uniref:Uncharacterized protein n=1 Tax=Polymorphospora lycopeni TaxID=3140240 RepID=A0ABV5CZS3_9ACTN